MIRSLLRRLVLKIVRAEVEREVALLIGGLDGRLLPLIRAEVEHEMALLTNVLDRRYRVLDRRVQQSLCDMERGLDLLGLAEAPDGAESEPPPPPPPPPSFNVVGRDAAADSARQFGLN